MRHHPLGNKPWKEELHHQESALDKKLREEASMEEKNEREGEGGRRTKLKDKKKGEVELRSVSHKFHIHQSYDKCTHASIYSLGH